MPLSSQPDVPSAEVLYQTFAQYEYAGTKFCDFCYDSEEWREFSRTPIRALGTGQARKLLWEAFDHWESPDVYRHYLPRMMEVLAPPADVEPLYPLHVSETLLALSFGKWHPAEREAIVNYLRAVTPCVTWLRRAEDRAEWMRGIETLESAQSSRGELGPSGE